MLYRTSQNRVNLRERLQRSSVSSVSSFGLVSCFQYGHRRPTASPRKDCTRIPHTVQYAHSRSASSILDLHVSMLTSLSQSIRQESLHSPCHPEFFSPRARLPSGVPSVVQRTRSASRTNHQDAPERHQKYTRINHQIPPDTTGIGSACSTEQSHSGMARGMLVNSAGGQGGEGAGQQVHSRIPYPTGTHRKGGRGIMLSLAGL